MTKSNLQEAVINYAIDMCANALKVEGISGVLEDNDIVQISKLISEIKLLNYNMIADILDDFEYNQDQRDIVFNTLERESSVAAMRVKYYFDNYKRRNK